MRMVQFIFAESGLKPRLFNNLFSCSNHLSMNSMKFKLLINTEIAKINRNFRFKIPKQVIYPAHEC